MKTKNNVKITESRISVADEFTQLAANCDIRRLPQMEEHEIVQLLISVNENIEIPYTFDIAVTAQCVRQELLFPTLETGGWENLPAARLYRKLSSLDDHALILLYARIYWWWRVEDENIRISPLGECFNVKRECNAFPWGMTGIEYLDDTIFTHGSFAYIDWEVIRCREYLKRLPCYAESLLPLFNPNHLCFALGVLVGELKKLNVKQKGIKSAILDFVADEAKYHSEYCSDSKWISEGNSTPENMGALICLKLALFKVARNCESLNQVDWIHCHLCNNVYITFRHYVALLCLVENIIETDRVICCPDDFLEPIQKMVT